MHIDEDRILLECAVAAIPFEERVFQKMWMREDDGNGNLPVSSSLFVAEMATKAVVPSNPRAGLAGQKSSKVYRKENFAAIWLANYAIELDIEDIASMQSKTEKIHHADNVLQVIHLTISFQLI